MRELTPALRLPSGRTTRDENLFFDAWDPIIALARKIFDEHDVVAYSPGIVFARNVVKDGIYGQYDRFELPLAIVLMLGAKLGYDVPEVI